MIEFLLLLVTVFFSMFLVYSLAKNDFVLLRKNVSLHELFDGVILSMLVGLLLARIFYLFEIQEFSWFHPFRFFHLLKLPGLSLFGFFVGIIPVLYFFLRKKKVLLRTYDIVFIALFPVFIFSLVTRSYSLLIPGFVIQILLAVAGCIILWICTRFYHNYTLKDGSIAMIICMVICLDLFLYGFVGEHKTLLLIFSFSQISSVILFLGAGVFLIKNQFELFSKKR
ncbi:MAG TPA: prolipoprotein diacylglyceryl transferase [Candidatus Levybacteria bacterium]|nr:prolipoprotein diacylglyceryl transferase [Candidatus Levybacteria bacterium]